MRIKTECDTLVAKDGWIACPVCRRNKRLLRITPETQADCLPVFAGTAKRRSSCISTEARALNAGARNEAREGELRFPAFLFFAGSVRPEYCKRPER